MSFVFCVRQDGTFFEGISNNVCVEWTTAMYPASPPVPGIWSQVPSILLPEGAAVGYFNAHAFSEQVMVPSFVAREPTPPRFVVNDRVCVAESYQQEGLRGRVGSVQAVEHDRPGTLLVTFDVPGPPEIRDLSSATTRFEPLLSDSRPLITSRWCDQNPEEFGRLWQKPAECPTCHAEPESWDGPLNSDVPTRCTHWACVACWRQIAARDKRCPICRDNLTEWIRRHEGGDESEESMDDERIQEEEGSAHAERNDRVRASFCEACDRYFVNGTVAWYMTPFLHEGRNLNSACAGCRLRLGLLDRPINFFA